MLVKCAGRKLYFLQEFLTIHLAFDARRAGSVLAGLVYHTCGRRSDYLGKPSYPGGELVFRWEYNPGARSSALEHHGSGCCSHVCLSFLFTWPQLVTSLGEYSPKYFFLC